MRSLSALITILVLLLAPVGAEAATRKVSIVGADTGDCTVNACLTLNYAVNTQGADGDTIDMGVGTFAPLFTAKRVFLVGKGAGDPTQAPDNAQNTTIKGVDTATVGGTALILSGGGGVTGVRLQAGKATDAVNTTINGPALTANPGNPTPITITLDRVVALGNAGPTGGGPAGNGIFLSPGANRTVTVTGNVYAAGGMPVQAAAPFAVFTMGTGVTVDLADSTFSGANLNGGTKSETVVGVVGGNLKLARSTVSGGLNGIGLSDADTTLTRTRVIGESNGVFSGVTSRSTTATVTDSLVEATSPTTASALNVTDANAATTARLTLTGSTIALTNPAAPGSAVRASGATTLIALRNTLAESPTSGLRAVDAATVTATHSAFRTVTTDGGGHVPAPGSPTNINASPGFIDFPNDIALLPTSPLIDKGDPAFVTPGELDLVSNPRAQNGDGRCAAEPDIGAIELASTAPPVDCSAGQTAATISKASLLRKKFTTKKPKHRGRKKGTRIRFTLSQAAKVKLSFAQKAKGRKVGKRCVKPTRKNRKKKRCSRFVSKGSFSVNGKNGANDLAFAGKVGRRTLAPGSYRLTLAAGASTRRLTFTILRP